MLSAAGATLVAATMAGTALGAQARPATRPAPARPAVAPLTQVTPAHFGNLQYRNVGPARGGRVTTVTGVLQEPHTFYQGTTGGGVWRTTDAGQTWNNLTDKFFNVGSMGDIDVADSDPRVIYAGTGSDGYRSNVAIGRGVYKSSDAGATWSHVGLATVGNIGGVEIHPSNPDIAFVAAIGNPFKPTSDRGVYRTTDGGKSWTKVLFVSDSTGAVDVEFQPGNPNVVYASMWRAERKPWTIISGAREGGLYKSIDGGTTWKKLTNGLPGELFGKSNIAVTPAAPNVLWVIIEAKPGSGLYRSDDAGESFTLASSYPPMLTRPFYYANIAAHPRDVNTVWVMSEGFYKTTDGGKTFRPMNIPHGDNHDLWINPNNPDLMVQGNDGGATVSLNGGRTWSTLYNQPTAEIYQVIADNQFPYRLYGAQQDNSTLIVPSLPLTTGRPDSPMQEWMAGPGCETGPIMPHRTNPDTVYGACKGQFSRMSMRSGQEQPYWNGGQSLYGNPGKDLVLRFQRVSPMEVSPHAANTVYYGSQYVHRTRDGGVTWETMSPDLTLNPPERQQAPSGGPITIDVTGEEYFSVVYAIRESVLEPGVIWTGANDGPFYITRDNGRSWKDITPRGLVATSPDFARNNFKGPPDGCRTQQIDPSPHRRGSAYYSVLCYLLGDFRPFIYRTDDYGATWTLLTPGTNGIPANNPTRVVREDPDREGTALRRHRVRHVHLVRQREAVAAVPAQPAGRPHHRHAGAARRPADLDAGTFVLDPEQPVVAAPAVGPNGGSRCAAADAAHRGDAPVCGVVRWGGVVAQRSGRPAVSSGRGADRLLVGEGARRGGNGRHPRCGRTRHSYVQQPGGGRNFDRRTVDAADDQRALGDAATSGRGGDESPVLGLHGRRPVGRQPGAQWSQRSARCARTLQRAPDERDVDCHQAARGPHRPAHRP